ncbi:MEDS domain-containing protein [Geodermatophilus sp. SYSU D01062]
MPGSGHAGSPRSRGARGHVCVLHDDVAEFRRRVVAFFAEGLREGLRVVYVGSGSPEGAAEDLAGLGDLDRLQRDGALQVLTFGDVYGSGGPVRADEVVRHWAAATERALADGFRGLRVSAEGSELLRPPRQRDAFARYEFLVGRYMADHPMSALCGFSTDLGIDLVTEFAALHAPDPSGQPALGVCAHTDGALGLTGETDPVAVTALGRVLARLGPGADTGTLVVDMGDVEYVDHRLLRALDDYVRSTGVRLTIRSTPPFAARLMDLLPASYLRPADVGAES